MDVEKVTAMLLIYLYDRWIHLRLLVGYHVKIKFYFSNEAYLNCEEH